MRALRVAVPLVIVFGLTGCNAADKDVTMPDVTGKKLDVAYDAIKAAGFDDKDKIEIDGGGTFGVVVESNWTVCEQSPAAGETVKEAPKLTVDRSCDEGDDESSDKPSETPSESPTEDLSETPSETPTETPSETTTEEPTPSPTESATPEPPAILTPENTPEFATLLTLGDNCSSKIATFAKTYAGQTVQFDGAIVAMAPHGSYDTRFDFLLGAGDFDPNRTSGPSFQFRDKNVFDLNLTGKQIPNYVKVGQEYTFIAELGDYSPKTCLFQLEPVETRVR